MSYTLKITSEQAMEMPMVDLAFEVLRSANTPFYYRDLMQEIAKIKGISDDEVMQVIAQLYTEINIDGRFACVGTNLWGLKRWYPVEKAEDAMSGTGAKRPRIINDDDDDMDDEELFAEEEEETFTADDEDYDSLDEDRDFDEEAEEEIESIDSDIEEDGDEELEEDTEEVFDAEDDDEEEDELEPDDEDEDDDGKGR